MNFMPMKLSVKSFLLTATPRLDALYNVFSSAIDAALRKRLTTGDIYGRSLASMAELLLERNLARSEIQSAVVTVR